MSALSGAGAWPLTFAEEMTPLRIEETDGELAEMDDFDVCELIWEAVTDAYEEHGSSRWEEEDPPCDYPESLYALELPEQWRYGYLIHALEYDYLKGGLREFFFNHDGLTNSETLDALHQVGATDAAEILAIACDEFQKSRESVSDPEKAQSNLDAQLAPLTKRLYHLGEESDPRRCLAVWVRNNAQKFR